MLSVVLEAKSQGWTATCQRLQGGSGNHRAEAQDPKAWTGVHCLCPTLLDSRLLGQSLRTEEVEGRYRERCALIYLPIGRSTPWPRPGVAFLNLTAALQACSSVCWSTPGERGKRAPPWSGGKSFLPKRPGDLPHGAGLSRAPSPRPAQLLRRKRT